jgi:uncharacterized protein
MEILRRASSQLRSVAIIGAGPAGMACGFFLHQKCDITVYEKNDYVGGHAHTVTIDEDGTPVHVDTAFLIFNPKGYPLFNRLLAELKVRSWKAPMSISFQHLPSGLEYALQGFTRLFADVRNLFNVCFLRMVWQIWRFQYEAVEALEDRRYEGQSIANFVKERGYGEDFLHKFLVPVISGLWSIPPEGMMNYPATTLVEFLKNHELLHRSMYFINSWRTIVDGSASYTNKISAPFKERIRLKRSVKKVLRENGKVTAIDDTGERGVFDHAILACHADQALSLLEQPTPQETRLLGKFKYARTRVVLHTDSSVMPRRRRAWASWNYLVDYDRDQRPAASFTYYMNMLQKLSSKKDYFVTVNDRGRIDPSKILREFTYEHPLFDYDAVQAQTELSELNKNSQIYFAGSYFKYGFHEDAIRSGVEVCRLITGEKIWE